MGNSPLYSSSLLPKGHVNPFPIVGAELAYWAKHLEEKSR